MRWQLVLLQSGRRVTLDRTSCLLGSGSKCAVRIEHPTVSRKHARLTLAKHCLLVEDLGSSNGTRVDGRLIRSATEIDDGARIEFGMLAAELHRLDDDESTPAIRLSEPLVDRGPVSTSRDHATLVAEPSSRFAIEAFPELLEAARARTDVSGLAARIYAALSRSLGFCVATGDGRLLAGRRVDRGPHEDQVQAGCIRIHFYGPRPVRVNARPAVELCAGLLDLAQRSDGAGGDPGPAPTGTGSAKRPEPSSVSRKMNEIYDRAERVAPSSLNVLIQGETGTGKELLAKFLHLASGRDGAFVAVNCAALSRDLLEAELFGIEAGVATGVSAREGRFVQADGGTLLLDEVTEMPDDCQAKLLRVLQEREVVPVGARQPRTVDVRVLAATNRDVSPRSGPPGPLRPDLVHRLSGWTARLPPLRERGEDIPQLAGHFFSRAARQSGRQPAGISHAAMDLLCGYDWPGNVRELEQEMQRAALFVDDGDLLAGRHLSPEIAGAATATADLQDVSDEAQRRAIEQALASHDGNATRAAEALGISRATLYRRMRDLAIRR